MEVSGLVVVVAGALAVASAACMSATRSIVKTVMFLIAALTSVSIMLYEAWGLGLAAAYFMFSVGGLSILILLAASITEPAEEPPRDRQSLVLAIMPAALLVLLVYYAAGSPSGFSRPVFFRPLVAMVAGLVSFASSILGLLILEARR